MQRYSRSNIFLHWIIALLIVLAFALGSFMTDMKLSPTKLQYYSWHKWMGVSIFALVIARLIARLISGAPTYPDNMPAWQIKLAHGVHIGLYLFMFAVPLSGYLYTCAAGYPVIYLGLFPLPMLISASPDLKPIFKEIHEALNNGLLVLVLLHFGAALKHHFIDKDGILQRMLPAKSN